MTPAERKILTITELLNRRESARCAGRTIVQCHGCFDIVHPGHIRHLQTAASLGDILLVSVTHDAGVAASKGPDRPVFTQRLRAENLAALNCVDWVCIDSAPTAEKLLARVRPDIYAKGEEYRLRRDARFDAERRVVERFNGRVAFTSDEVVFSSSALVEQVAK